MAEKAIRKIVEETIEAFGGEKVRDAVLYHLEHKYNVKPEEMIEKPEQFSNALKDIYGSFGSMIEKEICKRISENYGLEYKGQGIVEIAKELKRFRQV